MVKKLGFVVLTLLFLVTGAQATQLLGSYDYGVSGGIVSNAPEGYYTPSTISFLFGYDFTQAEIITPRLLAGTTGPFDFNSSSSDFSGFVQHLTNTSDEILYSGHHLYNPDGYDQGGSGGGNYESYVFPPFASLPSWQPEFVRLNINSLSMSEGPLPPGQYFTRRFSYAYNIDWEIWGTIQPVPEPATMLLIGSGLLGLWGARRKFKK